MNLKNLLLIVGLLLGAGAQGALFSYPTTGISPAFPECNINGRQNSQVIGGATESALTHVNVRLNLAVGYNGDLYVYLTHLSGFSGLLNRTGRNGGNSFGFGDAGLNVCFDRGGGGGDIHNCGAGKGVNQLTEEGPYQPGGRNVNPTTMTDASARTVFFNAFNGLDPNGTWMLFLADMRGGAVSTLVNWGQ